MLSKIKILKIKRLLNIEIYDETMINTVVIKAIHPCSTSCNRLVYMGAERCFEPQGDIREFYTVLKGPA